MYRTCYHCFGRLGRNDTVEPMPVGRRLAFDPANGRLWVVCPTCRRWNLAPLEERWEAIEHCDRLTRDLGSRAATDNVALTTLQDGTDLVRIGRAPRLELAWWRWSASSRVRRVLARLADPPPAALAVAAGAVAPFGVMTLTAMAGSAAAVPFGALGLAMAMVGGSHAGRAAWRRRVVARVPTAGGETIRVRWTDLQNAGLRAAHDGGLAVEVPHGDGQSTVTGPRALTLATMLLSRLNLNVGSREQLAAAVGRLERAGTPDRPFSTIVRHTKGEGLAKIAVDPETGEIRPSYLPVIGAGAIPLGELSPSLRLTLEMGGTETLEQRWLAGELRELEREWREAEELARIADAL